MISYNMNMIKRNISQTLVYQIRYQKRLSTKTNYPINVLRHDPRVCYRVVSQFNTGATLQDINNTTIESLDRKILYRSTINKEVGEYVDDATSKYEGPRIRRNSETKNSPQLIT